MSSQNMIRWSGFSMILAGLFLTLGTLIHPSKETPQTILAEESRLIIGHWFLTFFCAFQLIGLPGVFASRARQLGRTGLVSFLLLMLGTLFYAVSSDYGFNAPVLAREAPHTLDAINAYPSVIVMDGLFVLALLVGNIIFGITIWRTRALPAWSGILIAVGWPLFMVGAAVSLKVNETWWFLAVLGTIILSLGLAWVGYALWSGKEQERLQPA